MTHEERFDRLEHITTGMAEQHRKDFEEMKGLWREVAARQTATDRQIEALVDNMRVMSAETDRRFRETDRRIKEMGEETDRKIREMGESLDERISKLVSAIGEMAKRMNGGTKDAGSH